MRMSIKISGDEDNKIFDTKKLFGRLLWGRFLYRNIRLSRRFFSPIRTKESERRDFLPPSAGIKGGGEMKNIVSDYLLSNLIYRKFATSFSMV